MGGPSGPMLSGQAAAIWNKSIGPEGPPTRDQNEETRPRPGFRYTHAGRPVRVRGASRSGCGRSARSP
ncbi:DUF6053 domain-containing protein [Lysobacter enzymogenes]|uniref:DUF6053 domain-containing protein n=1 Tax=Lysobacter enzymogenes TaxID=69 RepID=UPI003D18C5AD